MSNQLENEVLTSQERRQSLLNEIKSIQQAINELSDEELEQITGGTSRAEVNASYRANISTLQGFGPTKLPISLKDRVHALSAAQHGTRFR